MHSLVPGHSVGQPPQTPPGKATTHMPLAQSLLDAHCVGLRRTTMPASSTEPASVPLSTPASVTRLASTMGASSVRASVEPPSPMVASSPSAASASLASAEASSVPFPSRAASMGRRSSSPQALHPMVETRRTRRRETRDKEDIGRWAKKVERVRTEVVRKRQSLKSESTSFLVRPLSGLPSVESTFSINARFLALSSRIFSSTVPWAMSR